MIGLTTALAFLLALAGGAKLIRPGSGPPVPELGRLSEQRRSVLIRAAGLAELGVAVYVLGFGGRPAAALLAMTAGTLLAISVRLLRVARGADCGCFGATASPVSRWHVGVDTAGLAVGVLAVVVPVPSLADLLRAAPITGLAVVIAALTVTALAFAAMTSAPLLSEARGKLVGAR